MQNSHATKKKRRRKNFRHAVLARSKKCNHSGKKKEEIEHIHIHTQGEKTLIQDLGRFKMKFCRRRQSYETEIEGGTVECLADYLLERNTFSRRNPLLA